MGQASLATRSKNQPKKAVETRCSVAPLQAPSMGHPIPGLKSGARKPPGDHALQRHYNHKASAAFLG
jgi:hypothetical protein